MTLNVTSNDPIDRMYASNRRLERGYTAGQQLGVLSCRDENCTILTTSIFAGAAVGTIVCPGIGTGAGVACGIAVGAAIIGVKEALK